MTETPEPQGPTTEAGRVIVYGSDKEARKYFGEDYSTLDWVLAIEAQARAAHIGWAGSLRRSRSIPQPMNEARAAAPPDIDANWLSMALAEDDDFALGAGNGEYMAEARRLVAEYRRLASSDATRREPDFAEKSLERWAERVE